MVTYPESLDGKPPPQKKRGRLRRFVRYLSRISLVLMVALFVGTVLWPYMVLTVPSGKVGVLWRRLPGFDVYCVCFVSRGTALDPREMKQEGVRLILPWDEVFLYDLRLQSVVQKYNAITKDGVSVTAQINVRLQLQYRSLPLLHKFIGPGYLTSVVNPEIGSQARNVMSQYTAQQVYTSRDQIQHKIRENTQKALDTRLNRLIQLPTMGGPDFVLYKDFLQGAIQVVDTLVLSIELPPAIVAAINRQTEQFYLIQEYKYRVQREAEESQRKQIEANGIAIFQRTVSQGISDSYLRWRGIEATLALAQSPNAKIVIIGAGKEGLPIILGNVDAPAGPSPTPQPPKTSASLPSEASLASANKTSPGALSTTSGVPPMPDNMSPDGLSAARRSPDKSTHSSSPLDFSDIDSILSRISGALRPTRSGPASGAAASQKQ